VLEDDLLGEGVEEADLHAGGPHVDAQHVGAVLLKKYCDEMKKGWFNADGRGVGP